MKKITVGCLLLLLCAIGFAGSACAWGLPFNSNQDANGSGPCPDTSQERARLYDTTFVIETHYKLADGRTAIGTGLGFLVQGRRVLTADHVLGSNPRLPHVSSFTLFIRHADRAEQAQAILPRDVLFEDAAHDIALFALPKAFAISQNAHAFPLATEQDVAPHVAACFFRPPFSGDFTERISGTIENGAYVDQEITHGAQWILLAIAPVPVAQVPGSSGGPLFLRRIDGSLAIIGTVRSVPDEATITWVYAVSVPYAQGVIEEKIGTNLQEQ